MLYRVYRVYVHKCFKNQTTEFCYFREFTSIKKAMKFVSNFDVYMGNVKANNRITIISVGDYYETTTN